jgi:spore coat protein U-like protein
LFICTGKNMKKIALRRGLPARAAVIALAFSVAPAALAGGTTNLTVKATILATCKIITAPAALAFGSIDPSGLVNVTATTTFTTKCSNGTTESASTDNGGNNLSAGQRRMQTTVPTGKFLSYGVAYTGDTTFTGTGFGAGAANTVTVTGTITPAQFQNAAANTTYTDTLVITVSP